MALQTGATSVTTDAGLPRRGSAAAAPYLTHVVAALADAGV
ncbi:MAG: hypothetical protein ACFCVK_21495 [Acidimicrobiales bacterium]